MSWSLGEVRSLCIKASRGAGFSWGLAEEIGFAVARLEKNKLNGVEALTKYLLFREKNNIIKNKIYRKIYCPILLGTMISDTQKLSSINLKFVYQPLLVIPFLDTNLVNQNQMVMYGSCKFSFLNSYIISEACEKNLIKSSSQYFIQKSSFTTICRYNKKRVPNKNMPYINILNDFAFKTYAPSTEESRTKGAGGGADIDD